VTGDPAINAPLVPGDMIEMLEEHFYELPRFRREGSEIVLITDLPRRLIPKGTKTRVTRSAWSGCVIVKFEGFVGRWVMENGSMPFFNYRRLSFLEELAAEA